MWRFKSRFILHQILGMEQKIKEYLQSPSSNPRPQGDQDPLFAYFITYVGEFFVQGYRLIENYGSILLFSLMQYQFSDSSQAQKSRRLKKLPPRFKLLLWQLSNKSIFEDGKNRRNQFKQMTLIGSFLEQVEFHLIYLRQRSYSIVPLAMLQDNKFPGCYQYFKKIQWIEQKNGCRPISQKEEGIQLHRLVQSFIKGAGEGRNLDLIRRMQGQNKFVYDLFKVINTVCYIVGKEILQNDYQTMSVQKWMRKHTQKKFRRYDLLMRGEHKCSIVDWKFTRLDAMQKIKGASTQRKNETYYQLARKDFKTDIQLKFYCFHQRNVNQSYHCFTTAKFNYQITTVDIVENERQRQAQIDDLTFNEISISDSLVDLIPDVPGGEIIGKHIPVIEIGSDLEIQNNSSSQRGKNSQNYANNRKVNKINERPTWKLQNNQISRCIYKSQQIMTNKEKTKDDKRLFKQKSNLATFSNRVYEIESD